VKRRFFKKKLEGWNGEKKRSGSCRAKKMIDALFEPIKEEEVRRRVSLAFTC